MSCNACFDRVNRKVIVCMLRVYSRYLDQLGLASKYNTKVYCRQTLVGGHYGLLNTSTLVPNPDFYRQLLQFSNINSFRYLEVLCVSDFYIRLIFETVHFCGIGLWGKLFFPLVVMLRRTYAHTLIVREEV